MVGNDNMSIGAFLSFCCVVKCSDQAVKILSNEWLIINKFLLLFLRYYQALFMVSLTPIKSQDRYTRNC